jgi:hypothetical protein
VAYSIGFEPTATAQISALPRDAGLALSEILTFLELTPWNGKPLNKNNPEGAVRTITFARYGLTTYLILEDQQRVYVLSVAWVRT